MFIHRMICCPNHMTVFLVNSLGLVHVLIIKSSGERNDSRPRLQNENCCKSIIR